MHLPEDSNQPKRRGVPGILLRVSTWGLALLPVLTYAQGPTGSVSGTVTDPQHVIVPQAIVTITSESNGAIRTSETGAIGEFSLALLPPDIYSVEVRKDGFRTESLPGIEVKVDQTVRLDVILQLGAVRETLVVSDAAPMIDPTTAGNGYVIDTRNVEELPLNDRNFLTFALLVPGVQMPADGSQNIQTNGSFSINGAREQSNNFLLDGADNNDPFNNQYSVLPPVEAIQEFNVQTTSSSAEFGRTAGAQINIVLKSGSDSLHGSLLELLRNRHLDARNFFDQPSCHAGSVPGTCAPAPGLDRSQYGGSLGGPIRKNRTFYFIAYEGLLLRQAYTREATVPSLDQREAALRALPASRQNPAGLAVLNLYPLANVGPNFATSNLFVSAPLEHNTENQGVIKIDHQLDSKDLLSAHYAVFEEDDFQPFNEKFLFTDLPGYGSTALLTGQNASLDWSHSATSGFANEARVAFNRKNSAFTQQGSGVDETAAIGFPSVTSNPLNYGYPNIELTGFDGIGTAITLPQNLVGNTFEYSDDAVRRPRFNGGRHQFQFGADVRRIQENEFLNALSRGEYLFLGTFTGSPLEDLIAGLPTVAITTSGDSHGAFRTTAVGLYVLDTIQVSPNFALTLGMRYEHNAPPVDIHNRVSTPDLSANSLTCTPKPTCQFIIGGTDGVPRATYADTAGDFEPRVGYAWRPFGSDSLVIRSAYGIYYDESILNVNIYPHGNPPFYQVSEFANRGTSNIQTILNPASSLPLPVSATMVTPNFRDGYLQQWHFTLEHQLGKNTVFSAAYVGSKGTHLLDQRQGNQAPAGGTVPYPQFGAIRLLASDGSSTYNSLQLNAQRRLAHRLGLQSAFTWSRSIDDVSAMFGSAGDPGFPQNSNDLSAEKALSDFQAKFRFVFSGIYDLPVQPFGPGSGIVTAGNRILGGWRASTIIAVQSGRPFTVNRGVSQSDTGVTLGYFDRPNLIANPMTPGPVMANPNPACHLTKSQGGLAADVTGVPSSWFNVCAFAAPSTVSFGNAGRNILIGPGLASADIALQKVIAIREQQHLEVRFEGFNVLNHPNFDLPNGDFDSPEFGVIQSANAYGNKPPRQIQLGLRYAF
jgi:hypothetical protein